MQENLKVRDIMLIILESLRQFITIRGPAMALDIIKSQMNGILLNVWALYIS